MKTYSKFNTDRKGNQIALTVTKSSSHEIDGQAIIHMGDRLTFTMDNPKLFSDFFDCDSLGDVIETALVNGWQEYADDVSPLYTGKWK